MVTSATLSRVSREADPSLKTLLLQEALRSRGLYSGALDNLWGQKSESAYQTFLSQYSATGHRVVASTFADPEDVRRFRACKAQGKSDEECFKVGDNGIGAWGHDTTKEEPMCALPPEDIEERWGNVGNGSGRLVSVTYEAKTVECVLADRMPRKAHITNGAGIDLNPGACRVLGIPKGGMVPVIWSWATT